jgi:hypothetical protein
MQVVGHEAVRRNFKGELRGALLKLMVHFVDDIAGFEEAGAKCGADCEEIPLKADVRDALQRRGRLVRMPTAVQATNR